MLYSPQCYLVGNYPSILKVFSRLSNARHNISFGFCGRGGSKQSGKDEPFAGNASGFLLTISGLL